jgi:hypothetical protein
MYPSGRWNGFWMHRVVGRGPMSPLTLRFTNGTVCGEGHDVVGRFTFSGEYDESTGAVRMVKQYVGKHAVLYVGQPDGEGSIQGTWYIGNLDSGSFLLRPVIEKLASDEPIQEIG